MLGLHHVVKYTHFFRLQFKLHFAYYISFVQKTNKVYSLVLSVGWYIQVYVDRRVFCAFHD